MKEQVGTVDATPLKRLYLSIIADYDTNKAICELIDNALDIWGKNNRAPNLTIKIVLDEVQQRIDVMDDAGGIDESDLAFVVGPGHTSNLENEETIGIFGVGTKRAVVALAQDIKIRTRSKNGTVQVEFDDNWIKQSNDWQLPVYKVEDISKGTTQIELLKLRRKITEETIAQLKQHLGETFARFLSNRKLNILLNGEPIKAITFENWAYPPHYEPRIYSGKLPTEDGKTVKVKAVGGLITESSPAGGEYGVYFYCNERLVARALKTYDVGFASGLAGKPHADISLTRVIVSLDGEARLMPWNSSKSDIDTSHEVFIALRNWLLQVVKDYASLSRRLSKQEGGWPEHVFRYEAGTFEKVKVDDFPSVNTSYLPPLPESRPRYTSRVQKVNKEVSRNKPWTIGIYESIIAVDWVLKQHLEQKNRIALIMLDSTLEIAFKEYLVNESPSSISERRLRDIFEDRTRVHTEIEGSVRISQAKWRKIKHYYRMRCQLIHQRATVSISDSEIEDFRSTVESVLTKLFGLKFKV
ncbi:ATP-binding protein [Candidatus Neomarinimicrobiota bacterium]